jgi:iron complex outermembrane receptor protein
MRFTPLYGAMALLFAPPLYAQDATSSDDELIVSATRTDGSRNDSPQVIKVIGEEEIAQQRQITSDTSQILSNLLPSFSPPRQKMSGSGETLRGRTPLVMIDGIPQSNPLRPTGREMHTIDSSMIERIEVIKGANASNGVGATGGVINIITKRAKPGTLNQHFGVQGWG